MLARTHLATIPGSGPNERIEVGLRQSAGGTLMIELRQQHFGGGIGWFDQRTFLLDPRQWGQLQAVLGTKGIAEELNREAREPQETIPFPGPNETPGRRPAAGSR